MYEIGKLTRLVLGHDTENGVTKIDIDMSAWLADMPDGIVSVWALRPDEEGLMPYPVICEMEDNVLHWTVEGYDTAHAGFGVCVVTMISPDGKRRMSRDITTQIEGTETGITSRAPEEYMPWYQRVVESMPLMERAEEWSRNALAMLEGVHGVSGAEMTFAEIDEVTINAGA